MDNEERAWHELSDRLDTITRLLSYLVAIEHDTLEKRAMVLSSLGLQVSEIARICGTTPNTISVRLAEAKKKGKKKKTKSQ